MFEIFFWIFAAVVLLFGFVVFRGAPYVPSHTKEVERAFDDLYKVTDRDVVVDVGSGDGVILRLAARRGAQAIGYELNPALVMLSRWFSRKEEGVTVHLADFWRTRLPTETTLVYAFTVERDIKKLSAKLQAETNRIGHPIHVITYGSEIRVPSPVKQLAAHSLYAFQPLQQDTPSV